MQPKKLMFSSDIRAAIGRGVDKVADAVKVTMGPKGRNVIIGRGTGMSGRVTKDGVTVARNISLRDPWENLGAELVKEASSRSNDVAGDGTTATCVLAQALYRESMRLIEAGEDPVRIKREIEDAVAWALANLTSTEVRDIETLRMVGAISANDADLGHMIADAMFELGKDGIITIEDSDTVETKVERVSGMKIDAGLVSPYMFTNQERLEAVVEDAAVVLTDQKIRLNDELLPILNALAVAGRRSIVVVAEAIEGAALQTMVVNKLQGKLNIIGVKAPSFGERRREWLHDIAAVTGATVISEETGKRLKDADLSAVGTAARVVSNQRETVFVDGGGTEEARKERLEYLDRRHAEADAKWDKDKLLERKARIMGGVAVFKVGATTETELMEKRQRVEDAVYATKGALADGYVKGGGHELVELSCRLTDAVTSGTVGDLGGRVLIKAMREPLRRIAENSGANPGIVLEKVIELGVGFDASCGEYRDMVSCGVIDPATVVKSALSNAASVAALLITTECAIVEDEKEEGEK